MKILFSERCLEYSKPGHPESPERVRRTFEFLSRKGFSFLEPKPCPEKDILLVHGRGFVEKIKGGRFFDPDTPNLPGIYEYAKLSAGSAVEAMKTALKGEKSFSLMRPPGHHAGVNGKTLDAPSLGFCYFNNVAVATKKALSFVERVAIVDIDCHFGNGTQQIFLGDSNVLYVSLHKFHPGFYPGGGRVSEENCLNYPLHPGTTEKQYLMTLEKALKEVRKFDPELVAVSAGFDTHKDDPLTGGLGLEVKSFRSIGLRLAKLEKPSFAVLEGGYGSKLPECVHEFLIGFSSNTPR